MPQHVAHGLAHRQAGTRRGAVPFARWMRQFDWNRRLGRHDRSGFRTGVRGRFRRHDLRFHVAANVLQHLVAAARREQVPLEIADRIARLGHATNLLRIAIQRFVVRIGVARQSVHVKHHHGRRTLLAHRRHHLLHLRPGGHHMPPVNAMDRHAVERVRLAVGARIKCLALRRRRDRQMVVLDQEQHGQLRPHRFGTRLQKLAFLRASVTDRMQHQWPRMMILDHRGHPDRLQRRVAHRGRCAENLQLAIRKRVGTHLATARRRSLLAEQPVEERARRHAARNHRAPCRGNGTAASPRHAATTPRSAVPSCPAPDT